MNRLLNNQLRRTLGLRGASLDSVLAEARNLSQTAGVSPECSVLLSGLADLFSKVSSSYDHYDRELELRARSLRLCSDEFEEANLQLARSLQLCSDELEKAGLRLAHSSREGSPNSHKDTP